jgi:hypothetical protein
MLCMAEKCALRGKSFLQLSILRGKESSTWHRMEKLRFFFTIGVPGILRPLSICSSLSTRN